MNDRTVKVREIFDHAAELAPAAERLTYLDTACAGDAELRGEVDALLKAYDDAGSFLDHPAVAGADSGRTERTEAFEKTPDEGQPTAATQTESGTSRDDALTYLVPSTKPGSIGRLGHYEILEVIGRGGFGTVLKAFDEKLHRVSAIKVLSPAYAAIGSARKRFIREAQTAAAVKNEHVVAIYSVQDEAEPPYLVMELIDGVSLQDKLDKKGPLSVKEILRIGMQMAEGLAAAHKQGLVHRDIKPANILLENGVERVKITDFGLARAVDDASVTQSGTVAGTPMYMSPEQAEGLPIDHRSDLFSLGTVLYAMCTGHPPFRASGTHAVLKRVIDSTPRPIREINNEIPDWLCDIIGMLHAKSPADRFQTAKDVAELLGQRLADVQAGRAIERRAEDRQVPVEAAASESINRPLTGLGSPRRRWKVAGALVAVAFLVAAVFASPFLYRYAMNQSTLIYSGTMDPNLDKILVKQDGEIVAELTNIEAMAHLPAGDYEAEIVCKEGHELAKFRVGGVFSGATDWQLAQGQSFRLRLARAEHVSVNLELVKSPAVEAGWVQLFNGKDIKGWIGDRKNWMVERNALTTSAHDTFLRTDRQDFKDFVLRFNFEVKSKQSEVPELRVYLHGFPSTEIGTDKRQAIVQFNSDGAGSFGISGSKNQTGFKKLTSNPFTSLNKITIESVHGEITVTCNGAQVAKFSGPQLQAGHIGLQASKGAWTFRKIEIKELPPQTPSPPLAIAPFDAAKAKEHQDAWARHLGIPVDTMNSIDMRLRLIPPGEFTMGSTQAEIEERQNATNVQYPDEGPAHRVALTRPWLMGAVEVTRGQFRAFIKATGYQTDTEKGLTQGSGLIDEGGGKRWDFDKKYTWDAHYGTREPLGDDHPVTNITWNDAKAFCKWLSETEGRVYDLPTEAQWEFACRAGSITPWHWGAADLARLPEYHNLHGVSEMGPEVVGQRKPNAFGLFNLQGSVLEWCLDYFAVYQAGRAVDPRGPAIGVDRVLRGSTFDCGSPWFLRSACRYLSRPQDAHAGRGFRVVCDPKPAALPGWVQLFNGKDLTGWRQAFPSQWKVDKGVISGAREQLDNNGQLRTEQVFQNFHCRLEVKMNPGGDAVFGFRAALDNFVETNLVSKNDLRGFGSLTHRWNSKSTELVQSTKKLTEDDSWVTLEVIAQGKKATVKVNGTTTAEKVIDGMLDRGFFDFGLGQVGSILQIRKIEIKELPPEAPGWIRGQFLPVDRAWVFSPMEGQIVEVNKDVKANMRVANKQDLFRVFNKELQTKFRELRYEFDEASKVYKVLDDNPKRTPEQTLEMQKARITRDAKRAQLEELRKRVNAIPDRDGEFWIRAPMEGVILTANFGENWMNRQIRPDEPLVHIAKARPDKVEDWELELAIPQSHIGEVRLAFAQLGVKELDVDILVTSAPKDTFKGRLHLDMISPVAVASSNPNDPEPVINARVRLSPKKDAKDILDLAKESMVPHHILLTGVQARARIVQSGKPGWVQLFNGQNTIGWKHHPNQSGGWHVLGGEMIGKGAPVNHLFTDRGDYENFYLRAKVKLDADSMAAVCLRTEFGLSDLDKYPRGYAVLLQNFGELRTGSLTGLQDFKESLAKSGEWFTLEAIAQGPRLTIKVNDKTTADFVDPKHAYRKGHIALRAIGPPQKGSVVFEKIEIKELPPEEAGWTPLFNGKDLTRWIAPPPGQGKGDWHVEDKLGQLVGRGAVASCIVTERDDFADFHLKTEVSCTGGTESGVYFRCGKDPTGDAAIPGYLVATGPTQGANFGALLLTTPDSKKTLKLFNPQAGAPVATFHQLEIVARGNQFTVKVNGKIVTDYKADPAAYTKGRIALRVFSPKGSGDGVVVFKKIEIKELPPMP